MSADITLKDQWHLARAVACDPRLSRADVAIAVLVIDRFYRSKGNARATFDWLADKAGVKRRAVIRSLQRLREIGYLKVVRKGVRGRATEYLPDFSFGCAADNMSNRGAKQGVVEDTLTDEKKGVPDDTLNAEKGVPDDTPNAEYGVLHDTPTYLHRPADKQAYVSRNESTRAAPPAPAPSGAPLGGRPGPGPARDPVAAVGTPTPFDELWAVYPRRHQRPKAKRAYQALNPDPANHARMLAAARDLAVYHETNGVDLRWCPFLHSWIEGERYLEDAPTPYKDPKAAAIAAKRGKPKAAAAKPTPSKAQKTKATGKTSGRPAAKPRAKRVARGPYTYAREIKRQERRRLAEEAAPKPLKPKGPPLGSGVWLRHQRQLLDVPACEVAEALAWRGEVEVHSFEERNNAVLSASQRKKLAPVFEAYAARTGGGPNGHVDA